MATTNRDLKTRRPRLAPAIMLIWREQMGYTQLDAANELGCSRKALINWEKGRHEIPRYIGLAMGALATGMRPYGSRPRKNNSQRRVGRWPTGHPQVSPKMGRQTRNKRQAPLATP